MIKTPEQTQEPGQLRERVPRSETDECEIVECHRMHGVRIPLFRVGNFFPEALEIKFVLLDLILERFDTLLEAGIVSFITLSDILLFSKLFSCRFELLLFLREFLFQNFSAAGVAAALRIGVHAWKVRGLSAGAAARARA